MSKMFPSLSGDFFPYSDQNEEYWTGYFTTRPFLKSLSRDVEVYLKAADILNTLATFHSFNKTAERTFKYGKNSSFYHLSTARKHLGLFQHHDAITGTARSWVAMDYEDRLNEALEMTKHVLKDAMIFLISINSIEHEIPDINIRVLNPPSTHTLAPTESLIHIPKNGCKIILFNNLAQYRHELIRIITDQQFVTILDRYDIKVTIQVSPVWNSLGEKNLDIFEIAFMAELSAMSFTSFNIVVLEEIQSLNVVITEYDVGGSFDGNKEIIIENSLIQAKISSQNGQLLSLDCKKNVKNNSPIRNKLNLQFLTYTSRRSGAYIFAPTGPATDEHFQAVRSLKVIIGPVFSEVIVYHNSVTHTLRVINCSSILASVLEVSNIVDLTQLDDKELIMRFNSSVQNQKVFYTDQNGYHAVKRKQFSNFGNEANYYPSTSMVYIEDLHSRLTVVTAQPVGVSSLDEGSVEIMLDRRLKYDDGRGLGEGILDNRPVLSRFYVILEHHESDEVASGRIGTNIFSAPSRSAMILADRLRDYPIISVSNYPQSKFVTFSPLRVPLPCDTILVNLRILGSSFLKRSAALIIHRRSYAAVDKVLDIEHLDCSKVSDQNFAVTPDSMFDNFKVRRVTLTALSLMNSIQKLETGQSVSLATNHIYTFQLIY